MIASVTDAYINNDWRIMSKRKSTAIFTLQLIDVFPQNFKDLIL